MKRKGEMMREGDYISFQKASAILTKRLAATREEVALWAWFGKRLGGFDAFVSPTPSRCCKSDGCDDYSSPRCDGFSPPLQYAYPPDQLCDDDKPWTWLVDAYFLGNDIESFDPARVGRFISWGDLLTRWQAYGLEENDTLIKVRGRIHDDELTDIAPLFGGTEIGGLTGAPKAWAMFPLANVEAIEAREFSHVPYSVESTAGEPSKVSEAPAVEGGGTVSNVRVCADFLALPNLSASEVSIEFAAGDSGGAILNVSARKVTRRIALVELDLIDRRKGDMNTQGVLLLGMAQGRRIQTADQKTAKQIERLRNALKSSLGIKDNPITYQDGAGYLPTVQLSDKRGTADTRAKREAERRTVSLDELEGGGIQFGGNEHAECDYESEGDAADEWLRRNPR